MPVQDTAEVSKPPAGYDDGYGHDEQYGDEYYQNGEYPEDAYYDADAQQGAGYAYDGHQPAADSSHDARAHVSPVPAVGAAAAGTTAGGYAAADGKDSYDPYKTDRYDAAAQRYETDDFYGGQRAQPGYAGVTDTHRVAPVATGAASNRGYGATAGTTSGYRPNTPPHAVWRSDSVATEGTAMPDAYDEGRTVAAGDTDYSFDETAPVRQTSPFDRGMLGHSPTPPMPSTGVPQAQAAPAAPPSAPQHQPFGSVVSGTHAQMHQRYASTASNPSGAAKTLPPAGGMTVSQY